MMLDRKNKYKVVSHFSVVLPKDIERFHLKCMLHNIKEERNYKELRTIEEIVYETFYEAARAVNITISWFSNCVTIWKSHYWKDEVKKKKKMI